MGFHSVNSQELPAFQPLFCPEGTLDRSRMMLLGILSTVLLQSDSNPSTPTSAVSTDSPMPFVTATSTTSNQSTWGDLAVITKRTFSSPKLELSHWFSQRFSGF